MKTIAVYGSLKKGKHNHSLLETAKFIGDTTVRGTLYSMGSYPALIAEGDNEYPAEVYEVDDEFYNSIKRMELGAGYREEERLWNVEIPFEVGGKRVQVDVDCIVYYADTELAEYCKKNREVISKY
jgi:gamma-glutamylcyclotransferase (GGCT)/AIG2-like uncharacterized protein YtfP